MSKTLEAMAKAAGDYIDHEQDAKMCALDVLDALRDNITPEMVEAFNDAAWPTAGKDDIPAGLVAALEEAKK